MASASPPRAPDRPTGVRHVVLAALLAITCINYVQRNAPSPASDQIITDLKLDRPRDVPPALDPAEVEAGHKLGVSRMGLILGAFFFSYTFMQVPAGAFAQRIGAKWALVLMATLWSVVTAACALSGGFYEFYAGRIALGVFQAGIFSCATLILSVWYPATRRGFATAMLNSFMLLGGVFANFVSGLLLGPLGWRWLLVVFAVPGLLWAGWFAWWFRSRPADDPRVNEAERRLIEGPAVAPAAPAPAPVSPRRALPLFAVLAITLLCAQQACRAGAARLTDNLMPLYYEGSGRMDAEAPPTGAESKKQRASLAAYLTGGLLIAQVVGSLMGGMLSDFVLRRTGSLRLARNGVALFSLLGSVALYLAAYPITNVYASTAVFGLGVSLFTFSSPCAYSLTIDMGGKDLAIVFSLMNMAGNLGAWAFVSFLPSLAASRGWDAALMVFVGMHLAAAACWVWLDPNAKLSPAPS